MRTGGSNVLKYHLRMLAGLNSLFLRSSLDPGSNKAERSRMCWSAAADRHIRKCVIPQTSPIVLRGSNANSKMFSPAFPIYIAARYQISRSTSHLDLICIRKQYGLQFTRIPTANAFTRRHSLRSRSNSQLANDSCFFASRANGELHPAYPAN